MNYRMHGATIKIFG